MSCAVGGHGAASAILAVPCGVLCGVAIGLVNGLGVAYLRIPSMIVTLATNAVAQGLMVVYTGGFSPRDSASPVMRYIATGFAIPGLPNAVLCWAVVGMATTILLTRTTFGRAIYGIGNRERAAYLSGVDTRRVVMTVFAISGGASALGGVLLAGYASKAAQSMGDAYLLPAIAAVVLGGTSILGGRGTYLGTVAGVSADHAAAIDPFGDADPRIRPPDRLWRRDHRHAAALRPGAGSALRFPACCHHVAPAGSRSH